MAGPDIGGLVSAGSIGRYFTVVSLVPSLVLSAYVAILLGSGALGSSDVDLGRAVRDADWRTVGVWSGLAVLLALALHPLQFNLIQLYEGYWGASRLGRWAALASIRRHHRRARAAYTSALQAGFAAQRLPEDSLEQLESSWASFEAWRMHGGYPHQPVHTMPTRLGNMLRRYEVLAGKQFELNAIAAVPRLLQVADPRDVEYVQNQRLQLELAVRTSALALLGCLLTIVVMWSHGWYLLLGLAPYTVAYLAYRGSVTVAQEYGTALAVLVELNRFALYHRLRIEPPTNLKAERKLGLRLTNILRLDSIGIEARLTDAKLRYGPAAGRDGSSGSAPPQVVRAADDS